MFLIFFDSELKMQMHYQKMQLLFETPTLTLVEDCPIVTVL